MRSTASRWLVFQSRQSRCSGARRVMERNSALYSAKAWAMWHAHSRAAGVRNACSTAIDAVIKIANQGTPEGAGGDLRGALHLTREVIGDHLLANGTVHGGDDRI